MERSNQPEPPASNSSPQPDGEIPASTPAETDASAARSQGGTDTPRAIPDPPANTKAPLKGKIGESSEPAALSRTTTERAPSRLGKLIFLALIALLIGGGSYYFLHRRAVQQAEAKRRNTAPPAIPVSAETVEERDIPVYLDGLGSVMAYNTVTVRPQIDGQIVQIAFKEGQEVHKGDLLVQIDPRTFQAQLDQTKGKKAQDEADLNNARLNLQRLLEAGDAVTKQSVSDQRALIAHDEAAIVADEAAIEFQQTMLSYTSITSPIDGQTGIRQVDIGNIVHPNESVVPASAASGGATTPGNGIVVITQLEPIWVLFSLPQQNLLKINQRMRQSILPVLAIDPDGQTELERGTLELVDNEIDATTGTIRLKAEFPNKERKLWPGGFVNARLLLETRHNALVVSAPAVQNGPNGTFVFAIKPDQSVEKRPVTVSMVQDGQAVLSTGVKLGDQVVLMGQERLTEGARVAIAPNRTTVGQNEPINTAAPAGASKAK